MQASGILAIPMKMWTALRNWASAARKFVRRHYNLMLDFTFWIQLYVQSKSALQDFGLLPIPLYPQNEIGSVLLIIQKTLAYPTFYLLILLVILGGLRDEFSEGLWAKAATSFAKFAVFFPFFWYIGIRLKYPDISNEWFATRQMANILPSDFSRATDCVNLGFQQLQAVNYVLVGISDAIPVVFAGFYKWHRWRSGN